MGTFFPIRTDKYWNVRMERRVWPLSFVWCYLPRLSEQTGPRGDPPFAVVCICRLDNPVIPPSEGDSGEHKHAPAHEPLDCDGTHCSSQTMSSLWCLWCLASRGNFFLLLLLLFFHQSVSLVTSSLSATCEATPFLFLFCLFLCFWPVNNLG